MLLPERGCLLGTCERLCCRPGGILEALCILLLLLLLLLTLLFLHYCCLQQRHARYMNAHLSQCAVTYTRQRDLRHRPS